MVKQDSVPKGNTIVGSRLVLNNKFDTNGVLKRFKARGVAQGLKQREGIN